MWGARRGAGVLSLAAGLGNSSSRTLTAGVRVGGGQQRLSALSSSIDTSTSTSTSTSTTPAKPKTQQALHLLRSTTTGAGLYAILLLKGRPYHVATGDVVVTNKLKDTRLGDILTLHQVREVGNAEYALQGHPLLPPARVRVEATVLGHPVSKERLTRLNKAIKGRPRVVRGETHHTALRIRTIRVLGEAGEAAVV
jgi:ribosomal protein L21